MKSPQQVVPVEGITAQWLTEVLAAQGRLQGGGRVISVERAPCGTGQLGDSYRFNIAYSEPGAGPSSLVGKFASKDPTSREFGRSSGYYRSEIGFYRELASRLSVSIPTAIHAAIADNETDFVLLMEDLAPARQVDQLVGCEAAEAALVLEQAAAFHAASWHDQKLASLGWLQGPVTIFTQVSRDFARVIEAFPQLCGDLVPRDDLDEAAKLVRCAEAWCDVIKTPRCLWHSDLRADNVLFDAEDGRRPVVLLDWQGLGYGQGVIDAAYWMGTSLTPEVRRKHERQLIEVYHDTLVRHGVRDYTYAQCWDEYRVHAIHGLQVGVFGLGAVKRTERGDQMWKRWIERTAAQVRDLDSFTLLGRR